MNGPRSIEAVRRATVSVCSVSGVPLGQGLLLSDSVAGPSVLTCHHVATAVPGHKLYVAVPDAAGHLSAPVRAIYDHARSDPSSDLAVLRASVPVPPRPLLHTLAPERYDGGLQQWVTGFTYLSPRTFDALLGIATPLRCAVPEDGRRDVPGGEYRIAHAFRLIESTDTREGISGAPVACDGGVLGLVHFARDASPNSKREGYMIPLANWARAWPELRQWLEPFVDAPLRSTVRVRRARDLTVGMTPQSNSGPDLTIAEYRADVYVRHPAAVRAAGLLDQHGEVLIVGRPMAGKTRLARELLGDRPDAIVVMPEADPPAGRIELAGISDTEIILLCDDIHASLGRVDVARWRRRLAEGGAPVRVLLTCRDGDDWRRIRQADSALAERYRESMVLLSAEEERGSDFPADSSRTLASLLGLSDEALAERFDGTPGSLTVDLAAMRSRYERLREEEVHGVPASRLLDSVKLLYRCNQSPIREQRARQVAEQVRGNVPLSDDTWEALRRRTAAAGFGSFATGIFKGYDPLLEQSVMYEPAEEARLLVGKLLRQGEAWDELLAFGEVPDVEARAREEMLACIEAHAEQDLALIARMRLAFLFAETERTDEVIESFRFVMRSGHPDHAPQAAVALGWHFEHWGRTEEAAIVWQEAIDSGHEVLAPQAAARLGILRSAEGQRDAAAAAYRIAIESGRGEVAGVAAYNLASLLTDFDAEEGLRLLQVAIDSGHAEAAPAAALTLASRQQGARQSQGKTPLLEIGATSPNPALARAAAMQLGLLHADSDDLDGARRVLYPVIESGSPDEATMAAWLLGDALNRNGDAEEAIGLLQIARASTDAERALLSAARLGELLVERGDFDGAADAFRQAMGGSGEVADMATMKLGVVEWRSGNRDSAEDLLGRASRSQFERARAQASAALALIGAWDGEDEQAVAVLSAEIASGDELRAAGASYSLGQLHHRAGRLTQAAEAFRRACSHETEWLSRAQFEFAAVQAALGHVDVAVELLREVVAATRDDKGFESERCHAALNLGVLLREQDDVPATIEPLRIASEACDDDVRAEALLRLGSSLCEIGAQREGLGVLQDAVDTGHERFTAGSALPRLGACRERRLARRRGGVVARSGVRGLRAVGIRAAVPRARPPTDRADGRRTQGIQASSGVGGARRRGTGCL